MVGIPGQGRGDPIGAPIAEARLAGPTHHAAAVSTARHSGSDNDPAFRETVVGDGSGRSALGERAASPRPLDLSSTISKAPQSPLSQRATFRTRTGDLSFTKTPRNSKKRRKRSRNAASAQTPRSRVGSSSPEPATGSDDVAIGDAAFLRDMIAVDSAELRALKALASMPPEAREQLMTLMKVLGGGGQQE